MFKRIVLCLGFSVAAAAAWAGAEEDCRQNSNPHLQIQACSEIIAGDDTAAWAYRHRADAHWRKSSYDSAIADYSKVIKLDPADAAAFLGRAGAYAEKDQGKLALADRNEAIRLYTEAIKRNQHDINALLARGSAYLL